MGNKNLKYEYSLDKLKDFAKELFDTKIDKELQNMEIKRQGRIKSMIQMIICGLIILTLTVLTTVKYEFIRNNPNIIKYTGLGVIIILSAIWIVSIIKRIVCLKIRFEDWDCLLIPIGFICPCYFLPYEVIEEGPIILLTLALLSVALILCSPIYEFEEFKKDVIKLKTKIFKSIRSINYNNGMAIFTNEELKSSSIFARYDTEIVYDGIQDRNPVIVDDTFCGEYKDVHFEIQEVCLNLLILLLCLISKYSLRLVKYYHQYSIFKGVIIQFDLNKNNKAKTLFKTQKDIYVMHNIWTPYLKIFIIYAILGTLIWCLCSKGDFTTIMICAVFASFYFISLLAFLFHFIAKLPKLISYKSNDIGDLKPVKLESPEWERRFCAYSDNQVEARYMLTTAFMERFLNLTTAFGTDKAKCSFYDDKIMIAISTKEDLFEFGNLFKPVSKDKFYAELSSILELIDYLKLDTHTGL